ncbi:MAG: MaoC family dehydratase [Pigmentiphaga sp.]|uniref:MaoC family dehydratase n=1 Tax=Pigmentiphaga sp. TaxID=1977564 RepID=UPI0029B2D888|nr:MaoC family dehydratase [Pigmentiphaga sp.]MDX3907237.1 MaoC family dehydratase [Pigmentiphaga sp.]
MRFADFHPGMIIEAGPRRVDEEEMLAFARRYDPQWFHVDAEAAVEGRFGALIASGWQTCGIAMELAVRAALHDSESFASPGVEQVRWPHPVFAGDELRLRAEVLEVRTSRSRPELGVLSWRWYLLNQHDKEVLELRATSLFDLRPAAARA